MGARALLAEVAPRGKKKKGAIIVIIDCTV